VRVLSAVALIAAAVWLGGLLILGAVVAPIIFASVPAPTSADAMILVFRRFDSFAMSAAACVLVVEAVRACYTPVRRLDIARIAAAVLAAGLAVWEGVSLSPHIEALHRSGAVRGDGAAGVELDRVHEIAERSAQIELLLLVLLIVLHAFSLPRAERRGAPA
jgi:putative copper export protein